MLLDDETVPYLVGECFVHLPREEVEERLQARECGGHGAGEARPVPLLLLLLLLLLPPPPPPPCITPRG